jgi:molybdopterin converting factor small subunit
VRITVSGYLKFRGFFGDGMSLDLDEEAPTLRHALEVISERCGESFRNAVYDFVTGDIKKPNVILVNGRPYADFDKGLDRMLKDGDEIVLSTLMSGG